MESRRANTTDRDTLAETAGYRIRTAAIPSTRPPDASSPTGGSTLGSLTNAALSRPSHVTGEKAGAGGNSHLSSVRIFNSFPGLVIDYDLVASLTDFTMQCDTTYLHRKEE